ncbi:hypothetical protein GAI72_19025 [Escherichia coli]|nr:hypothetical protein [Escherichia coli]
MPLPYWHHVDVQLFIPVCTLVTLSSVIEAFFGIRFTPVQNDGNFSKAADDYKRSLSKLVQNGAPKE